VFLEDEDVWFRVWKAKMHEFSIAHSLLESVMKAAEEQKAERVSEISVEMGQLLSIPPSRFRFAFKVCSLETKAEGAAIHVGTAQSGSTARTAASRAR
jgi:Zn finger protein HypA/HybF involved in hydrogenase expression